MVISATALAQSIKIDAKFGNVSKEELEMTSYAPDTSAVAVYLYRDDNVLMDFNANGLFRTTTYRRRIKVLKEDGREYADFHIRYNIKNSENVGSIKVTTYNLDGGKVTETKMGKDCIFHKNVDDNYRELSFTAQNVKVGSVIEVQFKRTSAAYHIIPDIYFQFDIPVNFAEASVSYPEYFHFSRVTKGFNTLMTDRISENKSTTINGGTLSYSNTTDLYSISDVPALRSEPMTYSNEQFRDHVVYDLTLIQIPGALYEDYSSTWAKVDDAVSKSDLFKACFGKAAFKDETDAILSGEGDEEQKIVAVRNLIAEKIGWDHTIGFSFGNTAQVLKNKAGSGPDINIQMAAALNQGGFLTEPVLVRLRESGPILDYHVSLSEFDTFILRIQTPGGKIFYLDAPQGDTYLNVFDESYLVSKARLVHKDGHGEWVDLSSLASNKKGVIIKAGLTDDGEIKAEYSQTTRGQFSQSFKELFNSYDKEEDYISDFEARWGVEVDSFEAGKVKDFTNEAELKVHFTKGCDVSGNLVYISPFIQTFHRDGLFKDEIRTQPVDFPYTGTTTYTLALSFPDTWTVEQMPKATLIRAEGIRSFVKAQFANPSPGMINVYLTIKDEDRIIGTDQYPNLRLYWDGVCSLYKELIILRKP